MVEGTVWPVGVVVVDVVGDESFELALVPDDGAIKKWLYAAKLGWRPRIDGAA